MFEVTLKKYVELIQRLCFKKNLEFPARVISTEEICLRVLEFFKSQVEVTRPVNVRHDMANSILVVHELSYCKTPLKVFMERKAENTEAVFALYNLLSYYINHFGRKGTFVYWSIASGVAYCDVHLDKTEIVYRIGKDGLERLALDDQYWKSTHAIMPAAMQLPNSFPVCLKDILYDSLVDKAEIVGLEILSPPKKTKSKFLSIFTGRK